MTLYLSTSIGLVHLTQNNSVSSKILPSVSIPKPEIRQLDDLRDWFYHTNADFSAVLFQAKDLIIKTCLAHEKQVCIAQLKYSNSVLRNCFEIVEFRFVVDERLRLWLSEVKAPGWRTKRQGERKVLRTLLCGGLNIVGVSVDKEALRRTEDARVIENFEEEVSRHYQTQPNCWERIFPVASGLIPYQAYLQTVSENTKVLCKWIKSKR